MKIKKTFIGWTNIKKFIVQIYKTLSAEKSTLSSKRLITFVTNNSVILLTWIFVLYMLIYRTLSALEFVTAIGPILLMGGYSLTKTEHAKNE